MPSGLLFGCCLTSSGQGAVGVETSGIGRRRMEIERAAAEGRTANVVAVAGQATVTRADGAGPSWA